MKKASSDRWSGRPSGASFGRGVRFSCPRLPRRFRLELRGSNPGVEVDDEVWPGEPLVEELEDLLVEVELVGIEGDAGEDPVLGEQIIGNRALLEEVELVELALLAVALEQEEELRLERMFFGVF